MDYSKYLSDNYLDVKIKDRVAIVTMSRPEKRNAINMAMHHGLETLLPPAKAGRTAPTMAGTSRR